MPARILGVAAPGYTDERPVVGRGDSAIDTEPLIIDLVVDGAQLDAAAAMRTLLPLATLLGAIARDEPPPRDEVVTASWPRGAFPPPRLDAMHLATGGLLVRFVDATAPPEVSVILHRRSNELPPWASRRLGDALASLDPGADATMMVRFARGEGSPRAFTVAPTRRLDRVLSRYGAAPPT